MNMLDLEEILFYFILFYSPLSLSRAIAGGMAGTCSYHLRFLFAHLAALMCECWYLVFFCSLSSTFFPSHLHERIKVALCCVFVDW